jgi:hypothetical protein
VNVFPITFLNLKAGTQTFILLILKLPPKQYVTVTLINSRLWHRSLFMAGGGGGGGHRRKMFSL